MTRRAEDVVVRGAGEHLVRAGADEGLTRNGWSWRRLDDDLRHDLRYDLGDWIWGDVDRSSVRYEDERGRGVAGRRCRRCRVDRRRVERGDRWQRVVVIEVQSGHIEVGNETERCVGLIRRPRRRREGKRRVAAHGVLHRHGRISAGEQRGEGVGQRGMCRGDIDDLRSEVLEVRGQAEVRPGRSAAAGTVEELHRGWHATVASLRTGGTIHRRVRACKAGEQDQATDGSEADRLRLRGELLAQETDHLVLLCGEPEFRLQREPDVLEIECL